MHRFSTLLAAGLLTFSAAVPASSADQTVTAPHIIDTIESIFDIPPGARRSHLKPGICVTGYFTGKRAARRFSTAALFSGHRIPVTGRFSLAGSNQRVADNAPVPRGMALAFGDTAAPTMNMAMISVPVFGAATPETFLGQMEAARPDPATNRPDPKRIAAFNASHADTEPLRQYIAKNSPAPDYAGTSFHSVHAFYFIDNKGRKTAVRWRFVPKDRAGQADMHEIIRAQEKGEDFLNQALMQRLQKGPLHWDMLVTIGHADDPTHDPTIMWPADRPVFKAGTLVLQSATAEVGGACDPLSFDPLVLPAGIEASDDPVLNMRSDVYRLSLSRRTHEQEATKQISPAVPTRP